MHTEAASALGDADERGDEVRQLGGQRRELVDDHEQARERRSLELLVGDQIPGAVLAEHALAVAQLGLEAAQRARSELLVEIGDHPDRVRKLGTLGERAAALVVDQHEVQPCRIVARGECGHQAPQQLALARAGRSGDQAVGPVEHQVERERTILGEREGGLEARPLSGRAPALREPRGLRFADSEQRQQRDRGGQRAPGELKVRVLEPGQAERAIARGLDRESGDQ